MYPVLRNGVFFLGIAVTEGGIDYCIFFLVLEFDGENIQKVMNICFAPTDVSVGYDRLG